MSITEAGHSENVTPTDVFSGTSSLCLDMGKAALFMSKAETLLHLCTG